MLSLLFVVCSNEMVEKEDPVKDERKKQDNFSLLRHGGLSDALLGAIEHSVPIDPNDNLFEKPSPENHTGQFLLDFGLACLEHGQVKASSRTFDTLKALQVAHWKRLPTKAESGQRKTLAWTGALIMDLAKIVEESLNNDSGLTGREAVGLMYIKLFRKGHRPSLGSFKAALEIFREAETPSEVYVLMSQHQSYGDWWKGLSDDQRQGLVEKRRKALREFWLRLTPEEKERRTRLAAERLKAAAEGIGARTGRNQLADKLDRADGRSLGMKDLEKGNLPGAMFEFEGVPEKMRSSWEALYARVIMQSPQREYIYEPMGFPMIDPESGAVEKYHPDFFEYTDRGRVQQRRVIEVKGLLTAVSRKKLQFFERYYVQEDYSALSPERRKLMRELVGQTRKLAWEQFKFKIDNQTKLVIMGELPWDKEQANFCLRPGYCGATRRERSFPGVIPRLMQRFPDLVPANCASSLSRRQLDALAKEVSGGSAKWDLVKPIKKTGKRIKRSDVIHTPVTAQVRLLMFTRIFNQAYEELKSRLDYLNFADLPNVLPLLDPAAKAAEQWHSWSKKERSNLWKSYREGLRRKGYAFSACVPIAFLRFVVSDYDDNLQYAAVSPLNTRTMAELHFSHLRLVVSNAKEILAALDGDLQRSPVYIALKKKPPSDQFFPAVERQLEHIKRHWRSYGGGPLAYDVEFIANQLYVQGEDWLYSDLEPVSNSFALPRFVPENEIAKREKIFAAYHRGLYDPADVEAEMEALKDTINVEHFLDISDPMSRFLKQVRAARQFFNDLVGRYSESYEDMVDAYFIINKNDPLTRALGALVRMSPAHTDQMREMLRFSADAVLDEQRIFLLKLLAGSYFLVDNLQQAESNSKSAKKIYQEILEWIPEDEDALLGMGITELGLGNAEAAENYLQILLKHNPDHQLAVEMLEKGLQAVWEDRYKVMGEELHEVAPWLEGMVNMGTAGSSNSQDGMIRKAIKRLRGFLPGKLEEKPPL